MTDSDAIALIEKYPEYDPLGVAFPLLKEHIDREKGCEWCKDLANPHWRGQHLALIEGDSFCRKCGRKLKTAMPGEEV